MPLIKSGTKEAVSSNIREMIAAGHPRRQAIAAALSTARRYGKKYADGGDVPDDTDRSLEQAYDPQAKTMRVTIRPNSIPESAFTTPEIVEAARQKYGPKGKGEPIWQAPPPSTYWQATHGIDTGESPSVSSQDQTPEPREPVVDPRGQQYVASQPWADPMSGEIAASPEAQRAFARAVGARGEERVHLAPEQMLVDPVRKLYDLARSGKFDPGVEPTEETAGAAMDVAASLAGGVRVGQAIHPGMIPSGSIGMHGSNIDWARFEKEIAELISPLGSHGPMKAMEPHKASWIDSSHFEKLSGAKGSNPGGMYRDPETAEEWYIKKPQSIDHLKNEVLANKLYQLAGVPVPDIRHTTMKIGDKYYPAIASPIVRGYTLDKFPVGDYEDMLHLKEHFPIDAWLANWDAVGSGKDNIVVNPITMEAHRIDAGGALNYRAQGSPKGKDFGNDVPELKTMLDPKKSPDAASVFQGADKQAIGGDAAKRLADISPSDLAKVVNEWGPGTVYDKSNLYDKLMLRRKAVVDHYVSQPIGPPPALSTQGEQLSKAEMPEYVPPHRILGLIKDKSGPQISYALYDFAKAGQIESALAAKLALPKIIKQNVNKILWEMKNTAKTPEEAELLGSLFADKKFPTPPKNVSKADTPKAVKDYDKEVEEYYQALDEQDQHQYEIAQGPDLASAYPKENPNAPGPNEVISHHEFSKLTDGQVHNRFVHQLTKIKNWREWKPSYKTYTTPKLSKVQPGFAKLLGFNTEVTFYKGGVHGYEGHFPDPAKKASEPGFFLADTEDVARSYAKSMDTPIDQYVVRAEKPGEIDWRKFTGGSHWDPAPMTKLIHQAKKEGLDILIIHNIEDVGIGKQTQYVVLNTNGTIRSVDAEFNPAKIGHGHSHWLLPGMTAAGAAGYGASQEGEPMKKFASGGSTPFHERAYNEAIGAPTGIAEPGVRHFATPHVGMIHSPVPGRTDKLSMNVRGGSYILPASVVSGIGQGNSQAGASILNSFFKQGPYGASAGRIGAPKVNFGKTMNMRMPTMKMPKFAEGGLEGEAHNKVPIVAAGGEYVVHPDVVKRLGGGDMKKGHEILDNFVNHMRRKTIQDMRKEKPPKK